MAKFPRNSPCPCGSGRKYKKCCWIQPAPSLNLTRENNETSIDTLTIKFDPINPPHIFFDTNVWISLSPLDIEKLESLKASYGFQYRYSVSNYIELISHILDNPSKKWRNPFAKVKSCFSKIARLCAPEVLPSPEEEFLIHAELSQYLDPVWIPNTHQTALALKLLANADSLENLTSQGISDTTSGQSIRWLIDPKHYIKLREIDKDSFLKEMNNLKNIAPAKIDSSNVETILPWFVNLASFFLLYRPSCGKARVSNLPKSEKDKFINALCHGCGRVFQAHCTFIAHKAVNLGCKIDANDLYDSLQLLLLRDKNRIFVTDEEGYQKYQGSTDIQRVLRWKDFKNGKPH